MKEYQSLIHTRWDCKYHVVFIPKKREKRIFGVLIPAILVAGYFYVGTLKGVGRIYQQTFVDTYSKWAAAKLYTTKTPITLADLLNDRVLPFFTE